MVKMNNNLGQTWKEATYFKTLFQDTLIYWRVWERPQNSKSKAADHRAEWGSNRASKIRKQPIIGLSEVLTGPPEYESNSLNQSHMTPGMRLYINQQIFDDSACLSIVLILSTHLDGRAELLNKKKGHGLTTTLPSSTQVQYGGPNPS
jgi:hypothetical protein